MIKTECYKRLKMLYNHMNCGVLFKRVCLADYYTSIVICKSPKEHLYFEMSVNVVHVAKIASATTLLTS